MYSREVRFTWFHCKLELRKCQKRDRRSRSQWILLLFSGVVRAGSRGRGLGDGSLPSCEIIIIIILIIIIIIFDNSNKNNKSYSYLLAQEMTRIWNMFSDSHNLVVVVWSLQLCKGKHESLNLVKPESAWITTWMNHRLLLNWLNRSPW